MDIIILVETCSFVLIQPRMAPENNVKVLNEFVKYTSLTIAALLFAETRVLLMLNDASCLLASPN